MFCKKKGETLIVKCPTQVMFLISRLAVICGSVDHFYFDGTRPDVKLSGSLVFKDLFA